MLLGGVLLGAGMELAIAAADHRNGSDTIRLMLLRVVGTLYGHNTHWAVLEGREHSPSTACWRTVHVQVRISALKRSLILIQ